jgi:hypothetical protein
MQRQMVPHRISHPDAGIAIAEINLASPIGLERSCFEPVEYGTYADATL